MAATVLEVALVTDASRFSQGFKKAEGDVRSFSKQVDQASGNSLAKLDSKVKNLGVTLGSIGLAVGVQQVFSFANDSIRAFSDLEQAVGGVESVFGSMSDEILKAGKNAASTAGLSEAAFSTAAARIGGMLQNLGLGVDETVTKTKELIQIGADLAATYGGTVEDAVDAIAAALRGETDPIERYAVSVKQADVNARALALGLTESTTSVDKHSKAIATLDLIYEQTAKAQGQFAREAETVAGQLATTAAEAENAKAKLGEVLAPTKLLTSEFQQLLFGGLGRISLGFLDLFGKIDHVDGILQDFQINTGVVADSLAAAVTINKEYGVSFEDLFSAMSFSEDGLHALTDSNRAYLTSLGYTEEEIAALSDLIDKELVRSEHEAIDAARAAAHQITEQGDASEDATGPTEDLADALKNTSDFAREAAAAQRDYRDALLESADPLFALAQAQERAQAAEEALVEARKDPESSPDDVTRATLEYANALIELEASARAAGDPTQLLRGLQLIADALGISRDEAELLFQELGLLDGFTVETFVNQTITTTERTGSRPITTETGRFDRRAAGGPVTAGASYLVGEQGPEMFVPNSNGRIVPHGQFGGGNSVSVTVNNPEPAAATRDIQRELLLAGVGRWAEVN